MTCRSVDTDSRPEMGDPGRLKHILILQNKIDLIKEEAAKEQHEQILSLSRARWPRAPPSSPSLPSSSTTLRWCARISDITKKIPVPVRDFISEPRLIIIR